ncbi:extracellular solute-binding protein [Synechococcus sp. A18-25c]|uniref:extracellular solute-binding protein n=1 Tax=Synechococcus sp. A18-25c TaxID=1866938 RepID=UPI00164929FB|nr:extracellular solute-binding protein [Synechococcus sp. A18-25c]
MRRIGLLALGVLLTACSNRNRQQPTSLLRVARTLPSSETVTTADSERDRKLLRQFQTSVREVVPGLQLQPSLYTESSIEAELRRQTNSGLGPDLVISDARTIHALFEARLLDPVPLTKDQRQAVAPTLLKRLTNDQGQITGLPVSQSLQLACYDKSKLKTPPASLSELAKASSGESVFGIAQNFEDLYWSMGSFEAGPALVTSLRGQTPTAPETRQLVRWLGWLQDTSFQQNVIFLRDQPTLRRQLIQGRLNWISCWSTQLPQLREAMKEKLGVSVLPAGPVGQATPVSKLQVWGLGRNSSQRQRASSEELMQFIVQPWAQKTWSLRYRTSYPVNPVAAAIVNSQIPGTDDLYLMKSREGILIGDEIMASLDANPELNEGLQDIINDVIFGTESPAQAAGKIHQLLKQAS